MSERAILKSRENVAKQDKFEVVFLGLFKDGMKWSSSGLLDPKKGVFLVISETKTSLHLIPEGGSMWDRFSVPRNRVKLPLQRVVE